MNKSLRKFLSRFFFFFIVTLLLLLLFLYGVMYTVCKGPSDTAAALFVRSVRETSAIGFLADLFFTKEEIAAMETVVEVPVDATDTSLITIATEEERQEQETDQWGFCDEDGDGLIFDTIHGPSYTGYMLIVLDPSRVVLGCDPTNIGVEGHTVEEYVHMYDAVAGINGGGFEDINGMGNGSSPDSIYIHEGNVYLPASDENVGFANGFVGIDENYILHVGVKGMADVQDMHIMEGTGFGPALVLNGQIVDESTLTSGLNPRTAIGQRSDGAILLLVIDGRQASSLGATYAEVAEIMYRYGAVNASNLDGGSSSLMYYNGEYVNNSASVVGIRDIPTSFVVLKEGAD